MTKLTKEQEWLIVYDALLAMAREVEIDPALKLFRHQIEQDVVEFQENYPEIVAEYNFNKPKGE